MQASRIRVAVYSPVPELLDRVASVLEEIADSEGTGRWSKFEYEAQRSDVAVVVLKRLGREADIQRLSNVRMRFPTLPFVLATRRDPDRVRAVGHLRLDDIVWISRMRDRLPAAVRAAEAGSVLRTIGEAVRESEEVPDRVQRAVSMACRRKRPVLTVTELAQSTGCDRRTLWYQWRKVTSETQLKDFVAWCKLFHSVELRRSGRSWTEVAAAIDATPSGLRSLAKRLTGENLSQVCAKGLPRLIDQFNREVGPGLFDRASDVSLTL